MAPPFFSDLGKNARDLFAKGYHFGLLKLDFKNKTSSGIEFSTGGVSNQETGKVFGTLETKYSFSDYGCTITEKWNTDNIIATEVATTSLGSGTKFSLNGQFTPHTGDKAMTFKGEHKADSIASNMDCDLTASSGPIINAASVLGYNGWLCGFQCKFDSRSAKLAANSLALGYSGEDMTIHTNVDNGTEYGGSLYHKLNSQLEAGIQMAWSAGSSDTRFGLGCKYNMDDETTLRAKVNNTCQIGLSYSQRIREGVTFTLSTLIDGKNFNEGGHKVGFALELEA